MPALRALQASEMRKQKPPAENVVKSQKGSAPVIPPPLLLFLELWKGRGETLVGKERGYITEGFSRNCRLLRKRCGREGGGHLGGEMGRWR